VDDTHNTIVALSMDTVKNYLKFNAALWQDLLYTIDGKLNLPKCKFVVCQWLQNNIGTLTLETKSNIGHITIKDCETNKAMQIKEIKVTELCTLLVLQNAPADNQSGNRIK
jgi:hypothetical protein